MNKQALIYAGLILLGYVMSPVLDRVPVVNKLPKIG